MAGRKIPQQIETNQRLAVCYQVGWTTLTIPELKFVQKTRWVGKLTQEDRNLLEMLGLIQACAIVI